MNASKVGPGELIVGVGGLALFLFLFLDWFGRVSAWEGFDVVDILLAAIGLGAAGLAAARAAGVRVGLPGGSGAATALAGFAAAVIALTAAVIALTFLLEVEERKIGIGLALVASLGITYGGWLATRERPTAAAPPRAARRAASSCGLVVRGVEMRVAWIRATDLAAV